MAGRVRDGVYHTQNLIVPEIVDLKGLGRADTGANATSHALDFIVPDFAFFVDVWGVKGTKSETAQARHTDIPIVLGDDA